MNEFVVFLNVYIWYGRKKNAEHLTVGNAGRRYVFHL